MDKGSSSGVWIVLGILAALIVAFGSGFGGVIAILAIGFGAVLLLVAVVMYFALRNSAKEAKKKAASGESLSAGDASALSEARRYVTDLRMQNTRLADTDIRTKSNEICGTAEKILNVLKEHPSRIGDAQMFLQYYLPTQKSILSRYASIQQGGTAGPELTEKVRKHLDDIDAAMKKQLANLYEDEVADMSAEMELMSLSCREDGLL